MTGFHAHLPRIVRVVEKDDLGALGIRATKLCVKHVHATAIRNSVRTKDVHTLRNEPIKAQCLVSEAPTVSWLKVRQFGAL